MGFLTHEIGSLAKPPWRVRVVRGEAPTPEDVAHARMWGRRLGEDVSPLLDLLERLARGERVEDARQQVVHWSSRLALRLLERAGLDLVFDGEQFRTEMYDFVCRQVEGLTPAGLVRSFDHRFYRKFAPTAPLRVRDIYHAEEWRFLRPLARAPLKIPLTGPYTLMDWSYGGRFEERVPPWDRRGRARARRQFLQELTQQVVGPVVRWLAKEGVPFLQIDEPAATTHAEEVPWFLEALDALAGERAGSALSVHICYSDYRRLFPWIVERKVPFWEFSLEFANRDSWNLGTKETDRPGYAILSEFRRARFPYMLGLGVVDVHTDALEPPELIRDRILFAVRVLGNPAQIAVTPDCGLRTRSWEVAYEKLLRLREGAYLASRALGVREGVFPLPL